jgi:universal stress protein E
MKVVRSTLPELKFHRNDVLTYFVQDPVKDPTTSLLIVLDAHETEHAGLNRVKEIPPEAVSLQIDLYIDRRSTVASAKPSSGKALLPAGTACQAYDKCAWLELLVQPLRDLGYCLDTAVIEYEHLHESIIKRATALGVDCILKPLSHHGLLRQLLFTQADWLLVRRCRIPLWLVSHSYRLKGKPVLAAVDVDVAETDQSHLVLNQRLLQQAAALAALLGGSLHMVNARSGADNIDASSVSASSLVLQAQERLRLDQMAEAMQLALHYPIDSERIHCEQGSVARVVNYTSQQIDAGVIVLASTTRMDAGGLLEDSVAEAVMASTDSDVLVVKPGAQSLAMSFR